MSSNDVSSEAQLPTLLEYFPQMLRLVPLLKPEIREQAVTLTLIAITDTTSLPEALRPIKGNDGAAQMQQILDELTKEDLDTKTLAKRAGDAIANGGIDTIDKTANAAFFASANDLVEAIAAHTAAPADKASTAIRAESIRGALVAIGSHIEVGRDLIVSYADNETLESLRAEFAGDLAKQRLLSTRTIGISAAGLVVIILVLVLQLRQSFGIAKCLFQPIDKMSGPFNVVVAEFPVVDADGNPADPEVGETIHSFIVKEIADIGDVQVRGMDDCGVTRIDETDQAKAEQEADALALLYNAHVVIYGTVTDYGTTVSFQPHFRFDPNWVATQPELVETDSFDEEMRLLKPAVESRDFSERISVIREFIAGLGLFMQGDYAEAENTFLDAADQHDIPGMEVFYIMAGNAASRRNDCTSALADYSQALETRPSYARGLLGRGSALFDCAGWLYRAYLSEYGEAPPFDLSYALPEGTSCQDEIPLNQMEPLLALAEQCTMEAAASDDLVPVSDVDVKVPFLLGQIYSWRSDRDYGADWDFVIENATMVIDLYDASDEARQNRIRVIAARAHETLGKALVRTACDDPQSVAAAIAHYEAAFDIIGPYPDVDFAQERQEFEQSQIDILKADPCSLN
jgi:tetratricopeptide (TPR) repeat protein